MKKSIHKVSKLYAELSFGSNFWLEGFVKPISGDTIRYHSARSDINDALITRALDGMTPIQWEGEKVPANYSKERVTFTWLAGLGCNFGSSSFDFHINGTLALEFESSTAENWIRRGETGVELTFVEIRKDECGDSLGYMFLSAPVELLSKTEKNIFKITGRNEGSMAWCMTYIHSETAKDFRTLNQIGFWYKVALKKNSIIFPLRFAGHAVEIRDAKGFTTSAAIIEAGDHSEARFTPLNKEQFPIEIRINKRLIDRLPNLEEDLYSTEEGILITRNFDGKGYMQCSAVHIKDLKENLATVSKSPLKKCVIHVVNSSHQDVAWMDEPSKCEEDRDKHVITPALKLLEKNPDFYYSVEDTLCLKEYLDRHPDKKDLLRKLTLEGRLEWGATFTQPYESLASGEALARQVYLGRKWLKKTLKGCDTHIAWNVDVPARSIQFPQILKKGGVEYLVISRHEKGFFKWRSPDGSHLNVFSPGHYHTDSRFILGGCLDSFPLTVNHIKDWSSRYKKHGWPAHVPVLLSTDMAPPIELGELTALWSKLEPGPRLRYNTGESALKSFFDEAENLPVITGERPNVWLYIHGPAHHLAISAAREAAILLPGAEKFSTISCLLNKMWDHYPTEELTEGWEALIYPDHGWGGNKGDVTDRIFKEKYESARSIGAKLLSKAQKKIASLISHDGNEKLPVVVFNSLSWNRTDPVRISFKFNRSETFSLKLFDVDMKTVPMQTSAIERYNDGSIKSIEAVFIASNVPSIGYKTYYLDKYTIKDSQAPPISRECTNWENDFYSIDFNDGGIGGIYDKSLEVPIFTTSHILAGEVFTLMSMGTGAGEFAKVQQPTVEGFDRMAKRPAKWRLTSDGPVFASFTMNHPFDHSEVEQDLICYKSIKRIDIETDLKDWDGTKYREFRLGFPVNMDEGVVTYEAPYYAVEIGADEIPGAAGERYTEPCKEIHPREVQDWISVHNNDYCVTFSSSVAVWDHIAPFSPCSGQMLQPVLLASRKSCHGEGNFYLQKGDHTFRFSIFSHRPDWKNGYKLAKQANDPLRAEIGAAQKMTKGGLPPEKSFFSISKRNALISAIKKCDDDDTVVFRLYEAEKQDAKALLESAFQIAGAWRTDLIEENGNPVQFNGQSIDVNLKRSSIDTFKAVIK